MSKIDDNLTEKAILRLKAEEKLREEQINMGNPLPESDTKKLLHELQVHQIELEMQNEELKEAYDTMEKALRKYTLLYDFAPMAYITLNYEALIRDLNFTSAEILGEKRFALLNTSFRLFLLEESKSVFDKFFTKLYANNTKESCTLMLGYNDKLLCHVYAEGIVPGDDRNCLLSMIDITGLKKKIDV